VLVSGSRAAREKRRVDVAERMQPVEGGIDPIVERQINGALPVHLSHRCIQMRIK